mmetsp:Transcript_31947/g.62418  ORF Transcript_31947/g.62418 Transcript_31947/m.62418 type:complete len:157 (-) Transcript_31947:302-772(-)
MITLGSPFFFQQTKQVNLQLCSLAVTALTFVNGVLQQSLDTDSSMPPRRNRRRPAPAPPQDQENEEEQENQVNEGNVADEDEDEQDDSESSSVLSAERIPPSPVASTTTQVSTPAASVLHGPAGQHFGAHGKFLILPQSPTYSLLRQDGVHHLPTC